MSYTYFYAVPAPSTRGPFITIKRKTRGAFVGFTGPCGAFGFDYAIFRNRASEVLVPRHDLTPETKAAIVGVKGGES